MKTYTVTTFEDKNGDVILPLPIEVLNELGWNEGTTLEWLDNGNGSFSLKKKETMLDRIKGWLKWKGKSSYSSIKMESMTKEEGMAAEAAEQAAKAVPVEEVVAAPKAAAKKAPAKKKAVAKKVKKTSKKKDK